MSVWLRYIAAYPDLIRSIGADEAAAQRHYDTIGRAEGRSLTAFDTLRYGASYVDLARTFGRDETGLERHYITIGFYEGRDPLRFDALGYAASNPDVFRVFGKDTAALTNHYYDYGAREGRSITAFDPVAYAAANRDVLNVFGSNTSAISQHYLDYGMREGRATGGSFSAINYLLSYKDLLYAGLTATQASKHYLDYGVREGRTATTADEQTTHATRLGILTSGALSGSADVDWYQVDLIAGVPVYLNVLTTGIGTATAALVGARIDVLTAFGNRIATHVVTASDVTAGFRFESFTGQPLIQANYYIAVTGGAAADYRLSIAFSGPETANQPLYNVGSNGTYFAAGYTAYVGGAVPSGIVASTTPGAVLIGGANGDTTSGSANGAYIDLRGGVDNINYAGASYTIDLQAGTGSRTGGTDDRLLNIENVSAFNGSMRLFGSDAANVFTTALPAGVIGNDGTNYLDGRGGDDTLSGATGSDTLIGGLGNDVLTGGAGADRFVFDSALGPTNVDRIADFVSGTDKIALAAGIFGASFSAANFTATGTATTADQRIVYDQATGRLFYDADGSGTGAAILFAQLAANTPLIASDIVIA